MRLSQTVLDVVRGAGGAAMALAIGCSSSQGAAIRGEPVARLTPVTVAAPAPQVGAPTTVAPPAIATLEALPPASPPTVAEVADAGVHPRHRRHPTQAGVIGPIGGTGVFNNPPGYDVAVACGRG